MRPSFFRISQLVLVSLLLVSAELMGAQEATVESRTVDLPASLTVPLRDLLNPKAHTVYLDGVATAQFWLRANVPQAPNPSTELGLSFGSLPQGALVGVVLLQERWLDYKGNPISDGLYTLRYVIQPADGNHMGVSLYRDFLLLIPAEQDSDPATPFDYDRIVGLSNQASGISHPAVLALFPVYETLETPEMVRNDMDQWTLAITVGWTTLGLTVTGQGEQ